MVMMVVAVILILLLSDKYDSNATLISMNKPIFTSEIKFPSITLCPKEQTSTSRIAKFVEQSYA